MKSKLGIFILLFTLLNVTMGLAEYSHKFIVGEDKSKIRVGKNKQKKNNPEMEISKWDNECQVKISVNNNDKLSNLKLNSNEEIKAISDKKDYKFYKIDENNFEFEVILKEKPLSNKVKFCLNDCDNLDFFYQPELTKEEIKAGCFRPENVIRSYAVYHKNKKGHILGQKNYKTGKAFHIYRPKLIDAKNEEIWAEMRVVEENELKYLIITMDENWLNNATYPVIVDPTFGLTSKGATSYHTERAGRTYANQATLSENGTITKLTKYIYSTAGSSSFNMYLGYYSSDGTPNVLRRQSAAVSVVAGYDDWKDADVTDLSENTAEYFLAFQLASSYLYGYYDSTAGYAMYYSDTGSAGNFPNPFGEDTKVGTRRFSIYATYTADASPANPPHIYFFSSVRSCEVYSGNGSGLDSVIASNGDNIIAANGDNLVAN